MAKKTEEGAPSKEAIERIRVQLASVMGRRDEVPNQELALRLATAEDQEAVAVLAHLAKMKGPRPAGDAIKVLYELGYLRPDMIAPYLDLFVGLLGHRNNRMVWGGMIAIASVAERCPQEVAGHVEAILAAHEGGSVITRDAAFLALARLMGRVEALEERLWLFLVGVLASCLGRDVLRFATILAQEAHEERREELADRIEARLEEMAPSAGRKGKSLVARLRSSLIPEEEAEEEG